MSARILAFDTATTACTVALNIGNEIHERFEIAPRLHSELIIPMINDLLVEASIKLHDLDAIAFGCGPGSFMGVRIATGIAQGLAFGIEKPVIPVSTLQTLAQTAYQETKAKNILAGWDARMHEIYWGAYQLGENGLMEALIPDRLDKPDAVQLPKGGEWLTVGNAWANDFFPHAGAMVQVALEKYRRGEVLRAEKAEPTYLRDKVTQ